MEWCTIESDPGMHTPPPTDPHIHTQTHTHTQYRLTQTHYSVLCSTLRFGSTNPTNTLPPNSASLRSAPGGRYLCTGVFTELIANIGVPGLQVEELYSMDESSLNSLGTIHGFIFLFKYDSRVERAGVVEDASESGLFFAQQVINNACATQALISILLNVPSLDLGPILSNYAEFATFMDPETRGLALSNQETIRTIHNSFARPEPFIFESAPAEDGDEVYHFVSYIPHAGSLYELDGLQPGPINHGPWDASESWLDKARQTITQRIVAYSSSEIRFNLMAIVRDRRHIAAEALIPKKTTLSAALQAADNELLQGLGLDRETLQGSASVSDDLLGILPDNRGEELRVVNNGEPLADDPDVLTALLLVLPSEIAELEAQIAMEASKAERWRLDNIRRRHNYIPFAMAMLSALGQKAALSPMIDAAADAAQAAAQASSEKKASA